MFRFGKQIKILNKIEFISEKNKMQYRICMGITTILESDYH